MKQSPLPAHPGLAKVRGDRLFSKRHVALVQLFAGRCRELFEGADVVSEGATRDEPGGLVYYGSTSVVIPIAALGSGVVESELPEVARVIGRDPHARLYALRIARREAWSRALVPLGRLSAEIDIGVTRRGVEVSVDVTAPLDHRVARLPFPRQKALSP